MRKSYIYLFITIIATLFIVGCVKENKVINNDIIVPAIEDPNIIINNPNIDIIRFAPNDVDNLIFDRVWYLDSDTGQGYIQKGFLFFNVTGEEASIIQQGGMTYVVNPHTIDPRITLNIFVCDEDNATVCLDNLFIDTPKHNKNLIEEDVFISDKNISYYGYRQKEGFTHIDGLLTDTDITSYTWCDHRYCFQVSSHYQFENITTALIQRIIERYSK